jgi:cytochrome b involved in lipid metabolism
MGNEYDRVEEVSNNEGSSVSELNTEKKNNKCEILYEGNFYDVSGWIGRHPGGNVINFYTDPREDATLAIRQFHHRSFRQVVGIMKSLKKRKAERDEREIFSLFEYE